MGKCFDEDSCSQSIEAAIRTAYATFGGFVPTKRLEEVVYAGENGKAFAEHAAAKSPRKGRPRAYREHDRLVQSKVYRQRKAQPKQRSWTTVLLCLPRQI